MADVPPTRNALHQVQQLLSQPRATSSISTRSADHLIELDRLRNSKNPLLLTEDQYAKPRLIQHNYLLNFLDLGQPRISVGYVQRIYYHQLCTGKKLPAHLQNPDTFWRFLNEEGVREVSDLASRLTYGSERFVANQSEIGQKMLDVL